MKISLIHPSRGRPKKAYETARSWVDKSRLDPHEIDYILSLDEDDPKLKEYWIEWDCEIVNKNTCVVEATNHAARESKGDILVYLSDDFKCPDNWGQLLIKEFDKYPGPVVLKVDDCLQKFHIAVLTIPIMNRMAYDVLGYFFHPDFKSMHVDEHLYWRSKKLGFLKMAPHLKFPHEHYSIGKSEHDETYRRSEANWDHGKNTLAVHKREGFIR